MAGSKGSKYFDVYLEYQVWLSSRNQKGKLMDGLVGLLADIDRLNSLKDAATQQGLSYRKAWGDIKMAEEFLGFRLIETQRGGREGGLSRLTQDGKDLVLAFSELNAQFDQAIHRITQRFFRQLNRNQ